MFFTKLILSRCYFCSSQCRSLLILVPKVVNKLPSQHWTKRPKIVQWHSTPLKTDYQRYLKQPVFLRKYVCAFEPTFLVQCCLRRIWTTLTKQYSYTMLFQHCIRYLPHKRCTLALGQPSTGNFFMQCWLRQKQSSEVCCKKRCS